MKFLIILSLLGGCANSTSKLYKSESHSCPKQGHGPCYLCDAPKFVNN